MEDKKEYNEKINKALIKRALGYSSKEIVEEFTSSDGDLVLTKRKVTKKNVPPDMSAVKILLNKYLADDELKLSEMTEEELIEERNRLLKLLKEEEYD